MRTCETCRFWRHIPTEDTDRGLCVRYAPKPRVLFPGKECTTAGVEIDMDPEVWWPGTYFEDFCGEWQEKNAALQARKTPRDLTEAIASAVTKAGSDGILMGKLVKGIRANRPDADAVIEKMASDGIVVIKPTGSFKPGLRVFLKAHAQT